VGGLGKGKPFHAALSESRYLAANLNDESREEFFQTGERHAERIYRVIREKVQPGFQPARVLDYGCGPGRVLIPFARRSREVVGVDVSPTMLRKAYENCWKYGVPSVRLMPVDHMDSLEPASFDLVHSFIVFQHIPAARGEVILRKVVGLIAEGGVGAIHITFANTQSALRRGAAALRQRIGIVHDLLNLVQRRPLSSPRMEMHIYSMNRVLEILYEADCSSLHIVFSNHCDILGAMIYFEKTPRQIPQRGALTLADGSLTPPGRDSAHGDEDRHRETQLRNSGARRIPPLGMGGCASRVHRERRPGIARCSSAFRSALDSTPSSMPS
jgi:SAM-dependent methyltransferase